MHLLFAPHNIGADIRRQFVPRRLGLDRVILRRAFLRSLRGVCLLLPFLLDGCGLRGLLDGLYRLDCLRLIFSLFRLGEAPAFIPCALCRGIIVAIVSDLDLIGFNAFLMVEG